MKNLRNVFISVFLCLCGFVLNTNAATQAEMSNPSLVDFSFKENGKVITYGDSLHFTVRLSNSDNISVARIYFEALNFNNPTRTGRTEVECNLKYDSGKNALIFNFMRYHPSFLGDDNSHFITEYMVSGMYHTPSYVSTTGVPRIDISYNDGSHVVIPINEKVEFYVGNANCVNNIHTGGRATKMKGKICDICQKEYTPKLSVDLPTTSMKLQKGKSFSLKHTPSIPDDKVSSWTSSKPSIATVSPSGKITAKKAGTTIITLKMKSGAAANCTVTVQNGKVKTTKISGLSKTLKLDKGKKATPKPVIAPITSSEKVSYSSSNKKVATVNSKGVVTAKKAGTAKITVKSGSKKFVIKVTVPKIAPTDMKGVSPEKTLKKGKSFTIKAKLMPLGAEAKVTYKSSDKKVATVNSKGKVVAKKKGTAVITVKAGKVSRQCKITVR